MKTKLFILFLMVITLSLFIVNAQTQTLGTYKQNSTVILKQTCGNCTSSNITSINIDGNTPQQILGFAVMTKIGYEYNYSLNSTSILGHYIVNGIADVDGINTPWAFDFTITPAGYKSVGDSFLIFLYILFIIFTLMLIYIFIINIGKLATLTTTISDVALSWSIYFAMLFSYLLATQYAPDTFLSLFFGIYVAVISFTAFILPIISLLITMIKVAFDKGKPMYVGEYMNY